MILNTVFKCKREQSKAGPLARLVAVFGKKARNPDLGRLRDENAGLSTLGRVFAKSRRAFLRDSCPPLPLDAP
jgi:hypothetical protein